MHLKCIPIPETHCRSAEPLRRWAIGQGRVMELRKWTRATNASGLKETNCYKRTGNGAKNTTSWGYNTGIKNDEGAAWGTEREPVGFQQQPRGEHFRWRGLCRGNDIAIGSFPASPNSFFTCSSFNPIPIPFPPTTTIHTPLFPIVLDPLMISLAHSIRLYCVTLFEAHLSTGLVRKLLVIGHFKKGIQVWCVYITKRALFISMHCYLKKPQNGLLLIKPKP